jgi:hypothetical protein
MPTMHIYQSGSKIASKEFYNDFRIVQEIGKDKLFWKADEEQSSTAKGGEIHIWIKRATYAPLILLVRPDWKLSVDGVAMGQRAYAEVDVEGKTIELHYGDYRFVCSFPTIEAQPGSKIAELRALVGKKDE